MESCSECDILYRRKDNVNRKRKRESEQLCENAQIHLYRRDNGNKDNEINLLNKSEVNTSHKMPWTDSSTDIQHTHTYTYSEDTHTADIQTYRQTHTHSTSCSKRKWGTNDHHLAHHTASHQIMSHHITSQHSAHHSTAIENQLHPRHQLCGYLSSHNQINLKYK